MMTLTTLAATSLVLAFLALSFLAWDRNTSHHQVFATIALFMIIGLLAKWVPLVGILGYGAITAWSVVRFVDSKRMQRIQALSLAGGAA